MAVFSHYIHCINCGNELTNTSELITNLPEEIECDFCGQKYPGLTKKIRTRKISITTLFILISAIIFIFTTLRAGFMSALFLLFPVFIIYLVVLEASVKKIVKF
ncbi:MAG: hypothetical protein ACOC2E_03345 [Bacteroidota bacterium]